MTKAKKENPQNEDKNGFTWLKENYMQTLVLIATCAILWQGTVQIGEVKNLIVENNNKITATNLRIDTMSFNVNRSILTVKDTLKNISRDFYTFRNDYSYLTWVQYTDSIDQQEKNRLIKNRSYKMLIDLGKIK